MRQLRAWCARLLGLLDRDRRDREFATELDSHVQLHVDDNLRDGMAPGAARREALVALGGLEPTMERQRDQQRTPLLDTLAHDLRFAVRMLLKNPAFTATAILTLALGIGANTAIFSVVDAVLLKPLPYVDPEQIVVFLNKSPGGSNSAASEAKFNVWREQTVFEQVAAYHFPVMNVTGGDRPEQVVAGKVSAAFFPLLGVRAVAGRIFSDDEDQPNGPAVAVLSAGFWRRRFGAATQIVGTNIDLNGRPHAVVGILGDGFSVADLPFAKEPDVWVPAQIGRNGTDHGHYFMVIGRLKPRVTFADANAQLQRTADQFRVTFPGFLGAKTTFAAEPVTNFVVRDVRLSLLVLEGAAVLILLIACVNVANLLLVRGSARTREIAVRAAIGAGRARIIRQLLTESVLLSLVAGTVGLAIGAIGNQMLLTLNPGNLPRINPQDAGITLDGRVLVFTTLLSAVTGILFGLFPAIQASSGELTTALKSDGERAGFGGRQALARSVLVVAEMALAVALVVGAALLIRTFVSLRSVDPGLDPRNVLTMRMSLSESRLTNAEAIGQLVRDGTARLTAVPGVAAAAATFCCVPLENQATLPFTIVDRPATGSSQYPGSWWPISPNYFEAFKIALVRGRTFTDSDAADAPGVVIINEALARRFWPNGDPLGERLLIGKGYLSGDPVRTIVGVVGDVRDRLNAAPASTMYVPLAQLGDASVAYMMKIVPLVWVVRTQMAPYSVRASVESELRQASRGLPVAGIRSMDEVLIRSTAATSFNMVLMTLFGVTALLLAAVGVYGVMAYSVQQRTHELGVRLAIGAEPSRVRHLVVRQGMTLALLGIAIGIASALGLARLLAALLFGVTAHDPVVFVTVPVLLGAVALLAVWVPAVRASRVNPAVALRGE